MSKKDRSAYREWCARSTSSGRSGERAGFTTASKQQSQRHGKMAATGSGQSWSPGSDRQRAYSWVPPMAAKEMARCIRSHPSAQRGVRDAASSRPRGLHQHPCCGPEQTISVRAAVGPDFVVVDFVTRSSPCQRNSCCSQSLPFGIVARFAERTSIPWIPSRLSQAGSGYQLRPRARAVFSVPTPLASSRLHPATSSISQSRSLHTSQSTRMAAVRQASRATRSPSPPLLVASLAPTLRGPTRRRTTLHGPWTAQRSPTRPSTCSISASAARQQPQAMVILAQRRRTPMRSAYQSPRTRRPSSMRCPQMQPLRHYRRHYYSISADWTIWSRSLTEQR